MLYPLPYPPEGGIVPSRGAVKNFFENFRGQAAVLGSPPRTNRQKGFQGFLPPLPVVPPGSLLPPPVLTLPRPSLPGHPAPLTAFLLRRPPRGSPALPAVPPRSSRSPHGFPAPPAAPGFSRSAPDSPALPAPFTGM